MKAERISNTSEQCVDLLLVFARGSSQNIYGKLVNDPFDPKFLDLETESYQFFQKFKTLLDQNYPRVKYKAVSVHNFPNKYSPVGYQAVPIFQLRPLNLNNALNAEASWWMWGDYQDSIAAGRSEVGGYARDEITRCPKQKIVMGGYSQGAHVVGESLFTDLTEKQRDNVAGVALFGDPKFSGGYKGKDKKYHTYPWVRGTAKGEKGGALEARGPEYVPTDMLYKTLSWCFDDDAICSGRGGIRFGGKTPSEYTPGHTRYATFGVPQAAEEIFQRMAPELYALDKSRGGVDKEAGAEKQPIPEQPIARLIDVMFLVDVSAGVDDVLASLRTYTDNVLPVMTGFFPNTRYGVADIGEQSNGTAYYPLYNFYQDLSYYQKPTWVLGSSALTTKFHRQLAYGGLSGGGVDRADPLGLAVEKTAMRASWRPDSIKHVILITDRPAKDPYVYNICDSNTQTNIGLPPLGCLIAPGLTALDVNKHPELCDTAWQMITQSQCVLAMDAPGPVHNITRTLNDYISVAQSQRVAVSVVAPHELRLPDNPNDKLDAEKRLEYFAKATGGLYLKYNGFNRAAYSDMLWQVLNHQPKQIALAYKDALDVLGEQQVLSASTSVKARANVPVTLDISQSNLPADEYKWDFNGDGQWDQTTESPTIEHTFTETSSDTFLQVAALSEGQEQARTTLPLTVESYDGPLPDTAVPELPDNIQAKELANGDIEITWEGGEPDTTIVLKDPATGLPIVSLPAEQGGITIPRGYYSGDTLLALAASDSANSEPRVLEIKQIPIEVANQEELPFVKFNGLSPGETVAGNEILNTGATTALQTATAPAVQAAPAVTTQTAAAIASPNVLAENVISDSQVPGHESPAGNPAALSEQSAGITEDHNQTQPYLLLILLVVTGGAVAGVWAVKK